MQESNLELYEQMRNMSFRGKYDPNFDYEGNLKIYNNLIEHMQSDFSKLQNPEFIQSLTDDEALLLLNEEKSQRFRIRKIDTNLGDHGQGEFQISRDDVLVPLIYLYHNNEDIRDKFREELYNNMQKYANFDTMELLLRNNEYDIVKDMLDYVGDKQTIIDDLSNIKDIAIDKSHLLEDEEQSLKKKFRTWEILVEYLEYIYNEGRDLAYIDNYGTTFILDTQNYPEIYQLKFPKYYTIQNYANKSQWSGAMRTIPILSEDKEFFLQVIVKLSKDNDLLGELIKGWLKRNVEKPIINR